jgi:hypothetical protein
MAGIHAAGAQTAPAAPQAASPRAGLPVTVTNTPLPVTGSLNIANLPLPVQVQGQATVGGNVTTQPSLPSRSFELQTTPSRPTKALGPNSSSQRYVISSISFVDSDSVPEAGTVFVATGATTDCSNLLQLMTTGGQRVEGVPHTMSELTFPQPLVLGPGECLVADGGNNTDITVVGYLLP